MQAMGLSCSIRATIGHFAESIGVGLKFQPGRLQRYRESAAEGPHIRGDFETQDLKISEELPQSEHSHEILILHSRDLS